MSESMQRKKGRVRPPRIHITYELETGGAMEIKHLPFIMGVLADLSGQSKTPLKPMPQRPFTEVDRDNFTSFMAQQTPRLVLSVPNRLTGEEGKLSAELNFKSMDDFEPARVAEQVAPLKELLDMRQRLEQLLASMEGNPKMEEALEQMMSNTEKALAAAKEKGLTAPTESPKTEA
jgi:type VI secretion system protein ImpB